MLKMKPPMNADELRSAFIRVQLWFRSIRGIRGAFFPTSLAQGVFYGWRIVTASFTILFVVVGIVYYSFPVFYLPLINEFGWSRAEVTAGFFFRILLIGPLFGISAG